MTDATGHRNEGQLQSLLDAVERLRKEQFARLDPGLVRELLTLHADAAAGEAELARNVETAVEKHLSKDT
jgi:hypothetical protein